MVAVVGEPDRAVRRHEHAMRTQEHTLAPGAQQVAAAVEHAHRMFAAVEGIDVVVLVDADRGDVGVEFHAGRQLRPVVLHLVAISVGAEHDRHNVSS
jgi:hypothetical protein